jgi:hypothetical protein
MLNKKQFQKITIFSDGSLLFDLIKTNKKQNSINYLDKDLKVYQKSYNKDFLNNSLQTSITKNYRKKYF